MKRIIPTVFFAYMGPPWLRNASLIWGILYKSAINKYIPARPNTKLAATCWSPDPSRNKKYLLHHPAHLF